MKKLKHMSLEVMQTQIKKKSELAAHESGE